MSEPNTERLLPSPEELHQGLVEAVAAYQKHLDSGGRDLEAEPKVNPPTHHEEES